MENKDELLKEEAPLKPGKGMPIIKDENPAEEFTTTASGKKIYDMGESVVKKINRSASFDKDMFFQDLYENYLCCVERNEPRQLPTSKIITHWDLHTTFGDFMSDSLAHIDKQLEDIKFAKAVNTQKMHALSEGFLAEAKIDAGSAEVGKKFGVEDYDAIYEVLCLSKEAINEYMSGRLKLIIDAKSGRVRMTSGAVL